MFVLGFFVIVVGIPVAGGIAYSAFARWLVTDKGIDVADEIERLRDRPLN